MGSRDAALPATLAAELVAAGLDPDAVARVVHRALTEDLPAGPVGALDATSVATVDPTLAGTAAIVSRAHGVIAGLPVAAAVFEAVAMLPGAGRLALTVEATDGDTVEPGNVVLTVGGSVRTVLTAERTALNLLCHLSGVASVTRQWVEAVAGTGAAIRDTRKTLPGLRALQKYAVRCGGGLNHRMSLSDSALVKDNHVVAAGGVAAAFAAVRARFPSLPVEVECDAVEQVAEAVAAGADLILCDNMSLDALRASVALAHPAGVRLEASGGLTLDVARAVAETGVDYLSVGSLTHSAHALDLGLDVDLGVGAGIDPGRGHGLGPAAGPRFEGVGGVRRHPSGRGAP